MKSLNKMTDAELRAHIKSSEERGKLKFKVGDVVQLGWFCESFPGTRVKITAILPTRFNGQKYEAIVGGKRLVFEASHTVA